MPEFREPKPNLIVALACTAILPFWLRFREHLTIKIRGDNQNLKAFSKHRRAVVLLNHPDRQDPFVIFELASQMREELYSIVARECFDWDGGWRGWLFQSLGCYSVARGKADFHSLATTKKILVEGRRKLVVFPEAEITADEEHVHHMHRAIFHIMLDVQKDLSEGKSRPPKNSVVIIPAAIKFALECDLDSAVGPVLKRMEALLGLDSKAHPDVHDRTKTVVDAYLKRVFDSYGFTMPQASLEKVAERAASEMIRKIESNLGMNSDDSLATIERLYHVRNKSTGKEDSIAVRPHDLKCAGFSKPSILSDLERIERLLVLERMLSHPTSEIQCCRMLDFIESELFDKITPKGWQSCVVSLGAPIDVSPFVEQYTESKEEGVNALREHFRQKLQHMLGELVVPETAG